MPSRGSLGLVHALLGALIGGMLVILVIGDGAWSSAPTTASDHGSASASLPAAPGAIAPTADLRQVYAQIGAMGGLAQANAVLAAEAAVTTMTANVEATQAAAMATAERELDRRLTNRLEIMLTPRSTTSPMPSPSKRICHPGTPEPGMVCYWPTSPPGPTATFQSCYGMQAADYNEWCEWRETPAPTATATPPFGGEDGTSAGNATGGGERERRDDPASRGA